MSFVDRLDEAPVKEAKTSPQPPRNKAKWRSRQIWRNLLSGIVAAVGLEPTTYRHEAQCTTCSHGRREEIEQAFVNWTSLARISKKYGVSRDSTYPHAHALGLMEKRRRNVRAALERIIEKAGEVEASATAIVGAISAYAKINASGQWVERSECVNLNELFNRMSIEEMDAYAKSGTLPTWFDAAMDATASDSGRGSNEQ